jgi:hypothetical protein
MISLTSSWMVSVKLMSTVSENGPDLVALGARAVSAVAVTTGREPGRQKYTG